MSEGLKALIESLEGEVERVRKEADEQIAHFEGRIEELNITWAAGHGFAVGRRAAFDSERYHTHYTESIGNGLPNAFVQNDEVTVLGVTLNGEGVEVERLDGRIVTTMPIDMVFPNLEPYIEKVERLRLDEPEQAMSAIPLVIWGDLREKVNAIIIYGGVDRPMVVHVTGMVFELREVDERWRPVRVNSNKNSAQPKEVNNG